MDSIANLDQRSAIRLLLRLKAGVPPGTDIGCVTLGRDPEERQVFSILEKTAQGEHTWKIIRGSYGQGKSHFLQFIRETALSMGFGVMYLSADADVGALNHPQRHIYLLSAALETRGLPFTGFGSILRQIFTGNLVDTEAILGEFSRTTHDYDWQFSCSLRNAVQHSSALPRLIEIASANDLVSTALSDNTRRRAYHRLTIIVRFLRCLGFKGLVILVDEAESIFTKLPNIRSRQGAYRCLSFYCTSRLLRNVSCFVAFTPDGYDRLRQDVEGYRIDWSSWLKEEPLRAFRSQCKVQDPIDMKGLHAKELGELGGRLRRIYEVAYNKGRVLPRGKDWASLEQSIVNHSPSPRYFIKSMISMFDALRLK